jgi:glycosyltransferase involved in cell wall biosynthesis
VDIRFVGIPTGYLVSRITFTLCSLLFLIRNVSRFDLVVDDPSVFSPTFSFLFARKRPVVANLRNIFGRHVRNKQPIAAFLPMWFEKLILNRYPYYIVVSPFMSEHVSNRSARCELIPNGIDFSELPPEGHTQKQKYIAFLGRIEIYQKGLDILMQALVLLKDELTASGVRMKMAGSGKDAPRLSQLIAERDLDRVVQRVGRIEGTEKWEFLGAAMMTVTPSRYEAMPRVPMESQAMGTPVVATTIPSFEFVMRHEQTGLLVPVEDADSLQRSIRRLLNDDALRGGLGREAEEFSRQFNRATFMEKRALLYEEIACSATAGLSPPDPSPSGNET